jgi:hypothetical protein
MQLPEGIEWLIDEPLSSPSSSSSLADSTHKSTHNPYAEAAHSVSRAEERFVESTQSPGCNSQRVSTSPDVNSQREYNSDAGRQLTTCEYDDRQLTASGTFVGLPTGSSVARPPEHSSARPPERSLARPPERSSARQPVHSSAR